MDEARASEIEQNCRAASKCISDLNHKRKHWQMSIPARRTEDPDLICHEVVMNAYELISEIRATKARVEALEAALWYVVESDELGNFGEIAARALASASEQENPDA